MLLNRIDPHHQCCFKCNLDKHKENKREAKCFIYLCRRVATLLCPQRREKTRNVKNRIQSPLSDGNVLIWQGADERGWERERVNETTFDEISTRAENLFYAFPAAQINLEVAELFVNNKSRHNPSFVVKDLSSLSRSLLFRLIYTAFVRCANH